MPTGDTWVNLVLKRFLSHTRLRSNFLAYLQNLARDLGSRIFPSSGLFTFPTTITQTITDFDLSISPAGPIEGIDDAGHVLSLEVARQSNIPYENDPTFNYWIGLHYTEAPEEMITNPRTGVPEYDKWREEVGESDNPTSVTDLGSGVIRFNVDSIFQPGVDHSGRQVMVWLNDPMSTNVTIAIETVSVFYLAGSNYIDTVAPLGQGTVSTNVGDYFVACLGVTIRKNATDPFDDSYVLIGYITGHAATPTHNADGQRDLSGGGGHTLQKAYDGLAAGGSGRTITVADSAIQLRQSASAEKTEDLGNAALRIRKDLNTALPDAGFEDEVGIDFLSRFRTFSSIVTRKGLADFGSYADGTDYDQVRHEEACDITAADQITLTRVGVDLNMGFCQYSAIRTTAAGHVVEVYDSPTPGNDGVYSINLVAPVSPGIASVVTLRGLDNSVPTLTLEAGAKCRFYALTLRGDGDGPFVVMEHAPIDYYREYSGNATWGWMGSDLPPAFNARNEWIDFDDDGTVRRVTFTGAEAAIGDYIAAINGVLVDSIARDVGGEVRIDTIRRGSIREITLDASQSANIVNDVFGTTTPTEVTGTDDTNSMGTSQGVHTVIGINPYSDDALIHTVGFDLITPTLKEIKLYADGRLYADGHIRSVGGDFYAPAGLISVRDNVTSQSGDVEAILGDVTAGDDVIAGDRVLAGTDVVAGDEVIATNDITTTLGDFVAPGGAVIVAGNVTSGGDFIHASEQQHYIMVPLSIGVPNNEAASPFDPTWLYVSDPATTGAPYWIANSAVTAARKLGFSIALPFASVLKEIHLIIERPSAVPGQDVECEVYKRTYVWTPGIGAVGALTSLGTADTSGWAYPHTDSLLLNVTPDETIAAGVNYGIHVFSDDPNAKIHAIRLTVGVTTVYP